MEKLKLGTKMREIPLAVSPEREAWLEIAEYWEQLCCGLIDRHEFNIQWASFMHKKETLDQRRREKK